MSLLVSGLGAPPAPRRTNPGQFIIGMLAATGTGAGLVSLPFLIMGPVVVIAFVIAAIVWAVGIAILGVPAWLILTWLGIRSRWAAMCLGALLSGAASEAYLIFAASLGEAPWRNLISTLWIPILIGAAGAVAGLVGWGVAYRPDVRRAEAEIDEVFG